MGEAGEQRGEVVPLGPEAGFLGVPPGTLVGPTYSARMFYSFQPALEDSRDTPLFLFFNGGPGAATSGILMLYGTGPFTLDAESPVDTPLAPNAEPYTRFANLLYVDERQTGFSYGIGPLDECMPGSDGYIEDAGDYVHALLDFLDAHASLRRRPIVLVGESYGGTRAVLMLYLLQHYAVAADPPTPLLPLGESQTVHDRLPWLRDRVQAHFDAVDPSCAGQVRTPEEVAQQFGRMVLIQPALAGFDPASYYQQLENDPDFDTYLADEEAFSASDVRKSASFSNDLRLRASNALLDPQSLEQLLGVPLLTIEHLPAPERTDAARLLVDYDPAELAAAEAELRAVLGDLSMNDTYWLPMKVACGSIGANNGTANALLDILPRTKTFITNARWDAVVYTEALPYTFPLSSFGASVDMTSPAGAARPGEIVLTSAPTGTPRVRFPTYEAGHTVTASTPGELGEDIEDWLSSP